MAEGGKFIQSINIQNFKMFDTIEIENASHFNLFIGHNSLGKTGILEAISFAWGIYPSILFESYSKEIRGEKITDLRDFDRLYHNFDTSHPIHIAMQMSQEQGSASENTLHYQIEYHPDETNGDKRAKLAVSLKIDDSNSEKAKLKWEITQEKTDLEESTFDSLEKAFLEKLAASKSTRQYHFLHEGGIKEYQDVTSKHEPIVSFVSNHPYLSKQELDILENNLDKRQALLEFIQKINPHIKTIEHSSHKNSLNLFRENMNRPFPLSQMGAGFIKIIRLYLILLADKESNVILFDEITDGLSPRTVKILVDHVLPLLAERNIQLFATTHSWDILNVLAETYRDDDPGYCSVYSVTQTVTQKRSGEDFVTQARRIPPQTLYTCFPDFIDFRREK
ncbi:AAA family ATPase [Candidatus Haliotispira prima]|uniref:AAA family ATPase n=1 Tax=Candidatus Haliotispira prima TaxID=3034016 RepID=A0ABY8MJS3_9SPIO|nr:AAA family ATPase [Candidatus Haliotispira prima]